MAYTTIDDPTIYFNTVLYTGNGNTGHAITGVGFQPDLVWLKCRPQARNNRLIDVIRGVGKHLESDNTDAEESPSSGLTAFGSDGFTVGDTGGYNNSSENFVAWNWKAGTSFTNDASSTGIGTIDSAGSFNNDSGFSIVSYTGNNTSGATLKHGLNTAPAMVIVKNRNRTDNRDWVVYHQKLTSASYYIYLNSTAGQAGGSYAGFWNSTAPNSSVITLGSGDTSTNGSSDTYVAYCFAEKQGYSKVGKYVGNGNADGTFVFCGFKPAFILQKRIDSTSNWHIFDNKRETFNPQQRYLLPNASDAEGNAGSWDFLSNGFKIRSSEAWQNNSGGTFIYMAFAESPFVNSNGVPNNAR